MKNIFLVFAVFMLYCHDNHAALHQKLHRLYNTRGYKRAEKRRAVTLVKMTKAAEWRP